MSWVMVGVSAVAVVGSVAGNIEQKEAQKRRNKAIKTMANAQAKLKSSYLDQSRDVKVNDLLAMTQDIDTTVGLELTNLLYSAEQTKGSIKSSLAERNIYGNSAGKIGNIADAKQELSNDIIQSKLEQQYKAIATELDSVKLSYEREALEIQLGLAGALAQQNTNFKSDLSIGLDAVQAGVGGASAGSSLKGSFSSGTNPDVGSISGASSTKALEGEALKSYDTGNNWWGGK